MIVELFAGAGGASVGMSQLPFLPGVPAPRPDWCDLRIGDVGAGLADLVAEGVRADHREAVERAIAHTGVP